MGDGALDGALISLPFRRFFVIRVLATEPSIACELFNARGCYHWCAKWAGRCGGGERSCKMWWTDHVADDSQVKKGAKRAERVKGAEQKRAPCVLGPTRPLSATLTDITNRNICHPNESGFWRSVICSYAELIRPITKYYCCRETFLVTHRPSFGEVW